MLMQKILAKEISGLVLENGNIDDVVVDAAPGKTTEKQDLWRTCVWEKTGHKVTYMQQSWEY